MDKEITRFTGDYPQSDDITYIVIRRKSIPKSSTTPRQPAVDLWRTATCCWKSAEKTRFSMEEYEQIMARYRAKGPRPSRQDQGKEVEADTISHATLEQSKLIVAIIRKTPPGGPSVSKNPRYRRIREYEAYHQHHQQGAQEAQLDTRRRRQHFAERNSPTSPSTRMWAGAGP
jgi:hypothetical protein